MWLSDSKMSPKSPEQCRAMSDSDDVWAARRTPWAVAEIEIVPGSKRRSDLSQEGIEWDGGINTPPVDESSFWSDLLR